MGEKDLALKAAERAIMLLPRAKDAVDGPAYGREPGVNSDDFRREQPCDLNSHPAVTNALLSWLRVNERSAHYAGPS